MKYLPAAAILATSVLALTSIVGSANASSFSSEDSPSVKVSQNIRFENSDNDARRGDSVKFDDDKSKKDDFNCDDPKTVPVPAVVPGIALAAAFIGSKVLKNNKKKASESVA